MHLVRQILTALVYATMLCSMQKAADHQQLTPEHSLELRGRVMSSCRLTLLQLAGTEASGGRRLVCDTKPVMAELTPSAFGHLCEAYSMLSTFGYILGQTHMSSFLC